MTGYLDQYGTGDVRRERRVRYIVVGVLGAIILGLIAYFSFRDAAEKGKLQSFLDSLRRKDYSTAYAAWGCTAQTPCRDYSFQRFQEDWGPNGRYQSAGTARVEKTMGCEEGLMAQLRFVKEEPVLLWVERKNKTVGFFPFRLRTVPETWRSHLAMTLWTITRNCDPIIE